jgi:putative flippase GtrA
MKLLVGIVGVNYFVANLLSITVCSLANFAVGDRWVFAVLSVEDQRTC